MAHNFTHPALAACLSVASFAAAAQGQLDDTITVRGRGLSPASVTGFGEVPLAQSPMQARVFGSEALAAANVQSLAGLTRLDAATADAYNADGYWSQLTVRGFVLDNRGNYLRDGLPINAETFITLANKERVELLKGVSGMQSGLSAPGGLVNLVVKRPRSATRNLSLQWEQGGTTAAQMDLGERFGTDQQAGLRFTLDLARLSPQTRAASGQRQAWSVAADVLLPGGTLLEAEFERSHRSQPSAPGFSLLGANVPDARNVNPRTNLNNQSWSLPVVLDGQAASVRITQPLAGDWRAVLHAGGQRLKSDDRVAFPFGCYEPSTGVYHDHGYCPDGSLDLYDFRSEGERRRVNAIEARVEGRIQTGAVRHQLALGMQSSRRAQTTPPQVFNFVGSGSVLANVSTPADPTAVGDTVRNSERRTEWFVRDRAMLSNRWELWSGVRTTRLTRDAVESRTFNAPWVALAWTFAPQHLAWMSWGQGVESENAPSDPRYTNAGEPLPALKSRQVEVGVKGEVRGLAGSLVAFDVRRPRSGDACTGAGAALRCTRALDGTAHHRGVEATLGTRAGPWATEWSVMLLDASREGSATASLNGLAPVNVPRQSVRGQLSHDLRGLPGASLGAWLTYESSRQVLPDNSLQVPGWSRMDLLATLVQRTQVGTLTWRAGIDNIADQRAWREAPYQFGHVYLFPLAPRSARISLHAAF